VFWQHADTAEAILDRLSLTNTPGSLRLVYEALRTFSEYARAKGWMDAPLALRPPAKNPPKRVTVYRSDEVEALVTAARGKSLRWWAFLATMTHTRRRISEVLGAPVGVVVPRLGSAALRATDDEEQGASVRAAGCLSHRAGVHADQPRAPAWRAAATVHVRSPRRTVTGMELYEVPDGTLMPRERPSHSAVSLVSSSEVSKIRIRPLTIVLVLLAALLVAGSVVYFTKTAADLPSFFPGHAAHSTKHHVKHGLALVTLALLALGGAWFTTAPSADLHD
jgi:hypothetical protein